MFVITIFLGVDPLAAIAIYFYSLGVDLGRDRLGGPATGETVGDVVSGYGVPSCYQFRTC